MSKIHVGMMLFTERPIGKEPLKSQVVGNYELLLADGRKIARRAYPTLYKMLGRFDYHLPNEQHEDDIQDHYIVARRLSREEMKLVSEVRKASKDREDLK